MRNPIIALLVSLFLTSSPTFGQSPLQIRLGEVKIVANQKVEVRGSVSLRDGSVVTARLSHHSEVRSLHLAVNRGSFSGAFSTRGRILVPGEYQLKVSFHPRHQNRRIYRRIPRGFQVLPGQKKINWGTRESRLARLGQIRDRISPIILPLYRLYCCLQGKEEKGVSRPRQLLSQAFHRQLAQWWQGEKKKLVSQWKTIANRYYLFPLSELKTSMDRTVALLDYRFRIHLHRHPHLAIFRASSGPSPILSAGRIKGQLEREFQILAKRMSLTLPSLHSKAPSWKTTALVDLRRTLPQGWKWKTTHSRPHFRRELKPPGEVGAISLVYLGKNKLEKDAFRRRYPGAKFTLARSNQWRGTWTVDGRKYHFQSQVISTGKKGARYAVHYFGEGKGNSKVWRELLGVLGR